jgi:hypothetical protein
VSLSVEPGLVRASIGAARHGRKDHRLIHLSYPVAHIRSKLRVQRLLRPPTTLYVYWFRKIGTTVTSFDISGPERKSSY